jgi:hypothetical protein
VQLVELWDGSGVRAVRCWRWVRATIGGTQVEPLLGGVGAGGGAIGAGVHQLVGGVRARGSIFGVVQQSLRGAIGAVRLEPKAARLLGAVGGGVVGA